ncbi:hypothetical protein Leryth_000370 [Lithospermum erythrorhizon]|nr:hypothetical protein Leryth_000370 [Lithospermum erythrorhizon]
MDSLVDGCVIPYPKSFGSLSTVHNKTLPSASNSTYKSFHGVLGLPQQQSDKEMNNMSEKFDGDIHFEFAEEYPQKVASKVNADFTRTSDDLEFNCVITSESANGDAIELLSSKLQSQTLDELHSSPQNSFYSVAQYVEAKESFTNTEQSVDDENVEKYGDSGETSNSYDIVDSKKTSMYRTSTGSDASEESGSSSLSSGTYKPHKANDIRWEAIRAVKLRYGCLTFNHFRLLKPLGSGDIGRVYLSELAGTRTHFAMKLMDKSDLASRKKLVRAQTEREILQSLDHPFLPTLYSHFETEKFSCLVMEFCPGGDLHALRQKQPGRYFSEHAARLAVILKLYQL